MNMTEKFAIRKLVSETDSQTLEIMYNNKVTDDWSKGVINQELIHRKIKMLDEIFLMDDENK